MAFQVSPGLSVSEIDSTNATKVASTSVGAFAGNFVWGPANKRVLVDSENTLVSQFGKPTAQTYSSFFSAANFLAYADSLQVVRTLNTNAKNAGANAVNAITVANEDVWENTYDYRTGLTGASNAGAFIARYPGALGNTLSVAVCSSNTGFVTPGFTANTVSGSSVVSTSANVALLYPYMTSNDTINISGVDYTISSVSPSSNTINIVQKATVTQNTVPARVSWQYASAFSRAPGTSVYAASIGSVSDEMHIAVVDTDGKISGIPGTILEKYESVSKSSVATNDDGSANYFATVIFNNSDFIYASNNSIFSGSNWANTTVTDYNKYTNYSVKFGGGSDGDVQDSNVVTALDLFANKEEVSIDLLISGEANATIANECMDIASQRKDCMAFISPLRKDVVTNFSLDSIISYRNSISPSNSYGFMDSGYKYQFDKYNNVYRYIPLNADIAGLCARTDNIRDPWWSPAGFNRGQILNTIKLAWNPSKAQKDLLYQNNINAVGAFPGEGIVLFGDKTLQARASAFDRINVRRLFIVLEKTISNAAKYALFEFNDSFTRSQFVSIVEPFLRDVKARRGIYDYRVVCDESNNTQQVIDTNSFVGDIYIKPARSINYIQLNFTAVRTGVEFSEISG